MLFISAVCSGAGEEVGVGDALVGGIVGVSVLIDFSSPIQPEIKKSPKIKT